MAQGNSGTKTFTAGGTVPRAAAVKLSSGNVVVCTASDDDCIGTSLDAVVSGDRVSVQLRQPSVKMIASAAIALGAMVALTTGGKVVTQATTVRRWGTALEAAGADGDIIEVLPGGYRVTTAS